MYFNIDVIYKFAVVTILFCFCSNKAISDTKNIKPLLSAHAHNDYWHDRPLLDALDHGFCSVECDVFLKEGELLVGHEPIELKPGRTLDSLYLAPLSEQVATNNGSVYERPCRFFLLVDLKNDQQKAYMKLREVLMNYSDILTTWDDNNVKQGAITVVVTCAKQPIELVDSGTRYVGIDGRLSDLNSAVPAHVMPMISDRWSSHFRWDGNGTIPIDEKAWLRKISKACHSNGRVLRFWSTPENEIVWEQLLKTGVDLINTDNLGHLKAFLCSRDAHKNEASP